MSFQERREDLDHDGGPDAIYDKLEGDEGDVGAHLAQRQRVRQPKVDEDMIPLRNDEQHVGWFGDVEA